MAGERLPVNIFQGVLPSSFLFIDDGQDDSKWEPPQGIFTPFSSITPGDAYGYFGQGLRFSLVDAVGVANTYGQAFRSSLGSPNGTYFVSCMIRPSLTCYTQTTYNVAPALYGRTGVISFLFKPTTGQNRDCSFGIFTRRENANPAARLVCKIAIWNGTSFTDTGFEQFSLPYFAGGNTQGAMPWFRISGIIENYTLASVRINGLEYYPNIVLPTSTTSFCNQIQFTGIKADNLIATCNWDIDQISVSETENRV